tara:strand:- start:11 stop:517 length:507 start_codon:yes stop_codon:yes gene_type:complete
MKFNEKKAVFFDRDNTLIKDNGYTYKKKDLKFLPGVIKGLKYLAEKNYLIIVITNQSGISRNYFKLKNVKIFHNFINYKLKKFKIKIDDFFVCGCHPEFPKKNNRCKCRKPSNKMLIKAIKKWKLQKINIFMIGDKQTDKVAALKTNIKFYYKSKKVDLYKQLKKIVK